MKKNSTFHCLIKTSLIINFLFFVLSVNFANGQSTFNANAFDSIVKANTYPIQFNGKDISGQGSQWLINEASKSNYFLVGERHGTANIPNISGAIFSKLTEVDYHLAALEIGRQASIEVQEILKNGGYDSLKTFLENPKYFQAIAFLDWKEESLLASRIVSESKLKEKAIWGLDQEFLFGFKMYLERLRKLATTDTQKNLLSKLDLQLEENRFLMGSPIKNDLTELKSLFVDNNDALSLLDALLISNKIYGRFRGEITRVESNAIRENLMKQNLVHLISNYEKQQGISPKVFFKFGGFHSAPSLSNGMSTLGTFIEEWAISRNETAFNIYIDAVSGQTLASGQDNVEGGKGTIQVMSYFGSIDPDKSPDDKSRHVFINQLKNTNGLFLIDLRPLRKHLYELSPFLNSKAVQLITGFDAYLAIPNVSPGTPFQKNN
ncbi:hypothetical protein [Pontimicrobium aquaticum]|uniref:Erythromycin esterase n=1 Tax=Pontimicrobium aquaticum TaxID=2565367 RepID=A0A4U0F0M8_9FLAO|nr:hypothetical protein [Pontimicrobium aquaticum]TJY37778.1 hypothetical protein E5167_00560 [Pontimicrobium aquaticum]